MYYQSILGPNSRTSLVWFFSFKFVFLLRFVYPREFFIVTNQKLHVFVVTKPLSLEQVMSDRDSENDVDKNDDAAHLEESQVYIYSMNYLCFY